MLLLVFGLAAFPSLSYAMPAAATKDQFGTKATWPADSSWRPIASVNDPVDAGVPSEIDFVGDAADPVAYYFSDGNYWYIRALVHVGSVDSSTFHDSIFVLIDRNDDNSPEYSFSWDSKSNTTRRRAV